MEIELGYFNLERTRPGEHDHDAERGAELWRREGLGAVGEFRVEASPEFELTDPALSVKGVLKEGVLQDRPG